MVKLYHSYAFTVEGHFGQEDFWSQAQVTWKNTMSCLKMATGFSWMSNFVHPVWLSSNKQNHFEELYNLIKNSYS